MDTARPRGAAHYKACLLLALVARLALASLPSAAPVGVFHLRGGEHPEESPCESAAPSGSELDSDSELGGLRHFRVESPSQEGSSQEGVNRDDTAAILRERFQLSEPADADGMSEKLDTSFENSSDGQVRDTRLSRQAGQKRRLERVLESSLSVAETQHLSCKNGRSGPAGHSAKTSQSDSLESASGERQKRARKPVIGNQEKAPEFQDTRPMICKEFSEKGVCRYGLSCIFVHDRTTYYEKWKEKVREQKRSAKLAAFHANLISEHCSICRDSYTEPVVTQCEHYFCSSCIIEHYENGENHGTGEVGNADGRAEGQICPVCSEPLHGIFNLAYDLQDKLTEQRLKQIDPTKITVFSRPFPANLAGV